MARHYATRRRTRRQNQTSRSLDLINKLSMNLEDDDNTNSQLEDDEQDIDSGPVDEEELDQEADAQLQSTAQTKRSDFFAVVINETDKTPARSADIRESDTLHEEDNDYEPSEEEEGEVPESELEDNTRGVAGSSSQSDNVGERDASPNREERAMDRQRQRDTEREEHEVAENTTPLPPRTRPRNRIVDNMEGQPPQTNQSSSRRRRRSSNESEHVLRRTRQRRDTPGNSGNFTYRAAAQSLEPADWETSMIVDTIFTEDERVIIEDSIYDEATQIMGLEKTWKDLMSGCRQIRDMDTDETQSFKGITDICNRIQALGAMYKKIQRDQSTGSITPETWQRAKRDLKPIRSDADIIAQKIERRAKEGEQSKDHKIKGDASEYAEQIYKYVVTSLSELAQECLKAHYSEDDGWLLSGGFTAVLNILDIIGKVHRTLQTLLKSELISMTHDISRRVRIPLRNIDEKFRPCELEERRRGL